ncbi:hypothetical protein PQR01_16385 [Paraburkholderia rhynchosiae]|uniref:Uncharacterized protein n=2 Tax=Paraburkholderia TaxID=1822464 RepID=A0ACC7NE62_9BURK
MHTGIEDRFRHCPQLAAYLRERAKGGVGVIGGAKVATELDAKRAIPEGAEVAAAL